MNEEHVVDEVVEETGNTEQTEAENVEKFMENVDYSQIMQQIQEQSNIINEQSELIKQMKAMLNAQFERTNINIDPDNEIEQYLNSADSLTSQILKSYNKE